jgi:Bacterial protein of unknown function (DUF899)
MGWDMPWYSAQPSLDTPLVGREHVLFHLVCYLRDGDRVFETYWTKPRGAEVLDCSDALMDPTVFGRQEGWENSPAAWPRRGHATRTPGRGSPVATPMGVARRSSHLAVATARSGLLRRSGNRGRGRGTASESLPPTVLPARPRRVGAAMAAQGRSQRAYRVLPRERCEWR